MITLEKIISSNLDMLKSQEAELLKSLSFVQKAKKLFQSQSTERRGRPKGKKNKTAHPKKASRKPRKSMSRYPSVKTLKPGTHIDNIVSVLKQKNTPLTSQELIDTLFSNQTKDKSRKHFRTLISPALSDASKRGFVVRKEGKILLPA